MMLAQSGPEIWLIVLLQDPGRHHALWAASFPRVRSGYVPVQPEDDWPATSQSAT